MIQIENLPIVLTGIGIIVAIVYYTLTLQNANKTRQAQLYMQVYDKLETRENSQRTIEILFDMNFDTVDEFYEKYGRENNPDAYYDWMYMTNILEGIGVMVRKGLLDIGLVSLICSGLLIRYWEKYEDVWKHWRETTGWVRAAAEVEYLYNALMEYSKKHPEIEFG